MKRFIRKVVVTQRSRYGDAECDYCGEPVLRRVPFNYPQVCHDCADVHVWHYCDRVKQPTTPPTTSREG